MHKASCPNSKLVACSFVSFHCTSHHRETTSVFLLSCRLRVCLCVSCVVVCDTLSTMQQSQYGPVKLFVGQVPSVTDEVELKQLFDSFGYPMEVVIMRDRVTGRHRGCAFVTYGSRDEADAAIRALNGQHIIRPQTHALQVRYADSAPALVSGLPSAKSRKSATSS